MKKLYLSALVRLFFLFSLMLFYAETKTYTKETSKETTDVLIRLGVPYYDDYAKVFTDYKKRFSKPILIGDKKFTIQVVVGTYDEILNWYIKGSIELAVLPPGAVADYLTPQSEKEKEKRINYLKDSYLGSVALTETEPPLVKNTNTKSPLIRLSRLLHNQKKS